jgi:SHS2 domain-containing protein
MYYTDSMNGAGYEEIEHTADWALRVQGEDLESFFRHAASGMLSLMGISEAETPVHQHALTLKADDLEILLVSFLEEILYYVETGREATDEIVFETIDTCSLNAALTCRPVLDIAKEIKAVTYHGLEIHQSGDSYETVIVFDV